MSIRRHREAYRETLRREILDAARPLFIRDGFEATSIRGIAAKAGCSAGILYHYFEDKQAIMAELVSETFAILLTRLTAIREDTAPIQDRLRRGLRAYIDFGLEHPHQYALLFMKPQSWEGNEKVLAAFKSDGHATFSCLLSLSQEAIATGMIRPEIQDSDELAQTLWSGIHGLVSIQIGCGNFPWVEQSRRIDRLIDILMAGIEQRSTNRL